jgi:hypothetical protein
MPRTNKVIVNTVGGELSPKMAARADLPVYQKGLSLCKNVIVMPQGGGRFRNGTKHVKYTRQNKVATFIPFQFSDEQSYLIEVTDKKFRFYKDEGAILENSTVITGVTQAGPGVITSNAHGLAVDDEVYIDDIAGMTELNGKFFAVDTVPTANTFTIKDIITGTAVDTSNYTAYTSGGTVARVYEIDAVYHESDIDYVQHAQNADTMYLACYRYDPRKLTRTGHAAWTLATYARTADPFNPTARTITAMTIANPAVFTTSLAHGFAVGDQIYIEGTGTPQVQNKFFIVRTVPTTTTFTIFEEDGTTVVDSTGWAHSAGNTATKTDEYPACVSFLDTARLVFASTTQQPETIFGSQAPSAAGVSAFDNFTTGTTATSAIIFTLTNLFGKVDSIRWLANTNKFLVAGCFGSVRRIYGTTEEEPISPTSVTAKAVNAYGVAFTLPVSNGASLFYAQRGRKNMRSLEYDYAIDGYTTTDRHLVAEHLTAAGIKQCIEQQGSPDIVWNVLRNGKIAGLTYKEKEDISGWFRAELGGSHVDDNGVEQEFGKVLSMGRMSRVEGGDQIWMVVEREINGNTVRSVEFFTDEPDYPNRDDFFGGTEDEDRIRYENAMYETQKTANHLDMASVYDGTQEGSIALSSTTTWAVVTLTGGTFTADMVGRYIVGKYDSNGYGGGRGIIRNYFSATVVEMEIIEDFADTSVDSEMWMLTTETVSGLDYLEGETVKLIIDGGNGGEAVVEDGEIALDRPASYVIVGLPYEGDVHTLNLDNPIFGLAQTKSRNIIRPALRFLNTGAAYFGSSRYRTEQLNFRLRGLVTGRPVPLFTGVLEPRFHDTYESNNKIAVLQIRDPLPCTLLAMDLFMDVNDD